MLSRAAQRVYWAGRYLERVENSARLIQQYSHLLLDLPTEVGVDWDELLRIVGVSLNAASVQSSMSQNEILRFLLEDTTHAGSVASNIKIARDNIRNTRELLPQESWENVNELYQMAQPALADAVHGANRFDVLSDIVGRCQQINGTFTGTMSRRSPYHFLVFGKMIERADMASRIVEVAAAYIRQNERIIRRYGSTLWTNVLKSVGGFQMYRQYCQPQVVGMQVVNFLLFDPHFPRSMRYCLKVAAQHADSLPSGDAVSNGLKTASQRLHEGWHDQMSADAIAALMDTLQSDLCTVHNTAIDTWFALGAESCER